MNAPHMFKTMPDLSISTEDTRPLANTIALGAVATGNIKAQLALSAAGNINSLGSIPATNAAAAKIGISNKVVAILLVDSVMMLTEKHKTNNIRNSGNVVKIDTASPTVTLKPEITKALAMHIPPANNNSIPQGISLACCQVSKF